jgi:Rieske Fe-S protein
VVKPSETFPIASTAERSVDRRRFLRAAGSAAVVAACGEWLASRVSGDAEAQPLAIELAAADRPEVGDARAVVDAGGAEALVVRLDESTTVAYDRRCPHLGCPVLWAAERHRFECPCHHAAFDARTGRVLFGPPRRGLRPVRLTVASRP